MADTERLKLPKVAASQAQKHVTVNETFGILDALVQTALIDRDLTGPPGSPNEGDLYIPAATATGAWAGEEDNIAHYINGAWSFYEPEEGWQVFVQDEDIFIHYDGSAWTTVTAALSKFSGYCNFDNTYGADPSPSWDDLLINVEEFDEASDVAIAANVATFTAPSDGFYVFHIRATIENVFGTTGNVDRTQVGLSINGSAPNDQDVGSTGFHNFSSRFESVYVTAFLSLSSGDTVNPQIWVEGDATENIVIGGSESTFFGYQVA